MPFRNVLLDPSILIADYTSYDAFSMLESDIGNEYQIYLSQSFLNYTQENYVLEIAIETGFDERHGEIANALKKDPVISYFLDRANMVNPSYLRNQIVEQDYIESYTPDLDENVLAGIRDSFSDSIGYTSRNERFVEIVGEYVGREEAQRIYREHRDELIRILSEEAIFLYTQSTVVSRLKRTFDDFVEAGLARIEGSRKTFATWTEHSLISQEISERADSFMDFRDQFKEYGVVNWIATNKGISTAVLEAALLSSGVTGPANPLIIGGAFWMVDP